jgi:hypothetical protein
MGRTANLTFQVTNPSSSSSGDGDGGGDGVGDGVGDGDGEMIGSGDGSGEGMLVGGIRTFVITMEYKASANKLWIWKSNGDDEPTSKFNSIEFTDVENSKEGNCNTSACI